MVTGDNQLMIVVGEVINTTRKSIDAAVKGRDADLICDMARAQAEAGAQYIDLNAGTLGEDEADSLVWLVKTVQDAVSVPLCIDSPDPVVLEKALGACKSRALINSITAESDRFKPVIRLVEKYSARVVALCMDERGIPDTAAHRLGVARDMSQRLDAHGVAPDDIFIDPLVKPIGVAGSAGIEVLDAVRAIKEKEPRVHIISGVSNISFGLPARKLLSRAFLVMMISAGLDAALVDPLDKDLMSLITASEALLNTDEFCSGYIAAFRSGKFA